MSFYQKIVKIGKKYIAQNTLFKIGFNLSPMYRRSTARITSTSKDLMTVSIKLPITYKNKNYVGSIFGGSMFSALDPIPMVQLINLLGDDYVVWDKSATIYFKRPAKENLYADFSYTKAELDAIKTQVEQKKEIEIIKTSLLTSKDKKTTYCELNKTIYIADKVFYKAKRKQRKQSV